MSINVVVVSVSPDRSRVVVAPSSSMYRISVPDSEIDVVVSRSVMFAVVVAPSSLTYEIVCAPMSTDTAVVVSRSWISIVVVDPSSSTYEITEPVEEIAVVVSSALISIVVVAPSSLMYEKVPSPLLVSVVVVSRSAISIVVVAPSSSTYERLVPAVVRIVTVSVDCSSERSTSIVDEPSVSDKIPVDDANVRSEL